MTGEALIGLAGNLAVNTRLGDAEARHRSAVSRAYYGAFHLALAFLSELGVRVPQNHLGHDEAYKVLANCGVRDAEVAARLLSDLRADRNRADYRLDDERFREPSKAIRAVEAARELQLCLESCFRDHDRETLAKGIESYRAKTGG